MATTEATLPATGLSRLRTGKRKRPRRCVLYGVEGIGKTTWASQAPNPVFVTTENGVDDLNVTSFPVATTFGDFSSNLAALRKEDHDFQTCVIDSADWLEPLIWSKVSDGGGKQNIEDFGYGKGYTLANDVWSKVLSFLDLLVDERGMSIVFLAHCQIKTFNDPLNPPYDQYSPKLHKGASALIREWADEVFFAKMRTTIQSSDTGFNKEVRRAVTNGDRIIYTIESPACMAKNRLGMPSEIPLKWEDYQQFWP